MTTPLQPAVIYNSKFRGPSGMLNPHKHDVLSGRGNFVNNHDGNKRFRTIVNQHKQEYVACPKSEKPKYAELIVNEIRDLNPPGRFLKKDNTTKLWYDIGRKKSLEKSRQALREGAPEIMKGLKPTEQFSPRQVSAHKSTISKKELSSNEAIPMSRHIPNLGISGEGVEGISTYPDDFVSVTKNKSVGKLSTDLDTIDPFFEQSRRYISSIALNTENELVGNFSTDLNAKEPFLEHSSQFISSKKNFASDTTISISDLKRNWSDSDLSRFDDIWNASCRFGQIFKKEDSSRTKSTTNSRRSMFTGSLGSTNLMDDSNPTLQSTRGASSFLDMSLSEFGDDNVNHNHQYILGIPTNGTVDNSEIHTTIQSTRTRSQSLGEISISSFARNSHWGSNMLFSFSTVDNLDDYL